MNAAFIDHVWQSSLFAVLAWALAQVFRRNGANVRYGIWFAASLKFLIPFSLLGSLGSVLSEGGVESAWIPVVKQLAAPLIQPAASFSTTGTHSTSLLGPPLIVLWGLGFSVLISRWLVRWMRIRAVVRTATSIEVVAPIAVVTSEELHEPGVIGFFRPVLLLPVEIEQRLAPHELQAIIEHEICHVRRHDNLTAALHMLVEAVFWFNPLVWWIGARLIREREQACDEEVIRKGHERQAYAEGILKVCRHFLASKLVCVSGVSGADLKSRMETIMRNDSIVGVSLGKRLLLASAAVAAFAAPVVVGLSIPSQGLARTSAATTMAAATATSVGKIQLLEGKRVKLSYQNVEVRSLLQALAEAAQVNMLISDKVIGTVTVDLKEMPWEQALGIVLQSRGLTKRARDGMIIVEPAGT